MEKSKIDESVELARFVSSSIGSFGFLRLVEPISKQITQVDVCGRDSVLSCGAVRLCSLFVFLLARQELAKIEICRAANGASRSKGIFSFPEAPGFREPNAKGIQCFRTGTRGIGWSNPLVLPVHLRKVV